VPGAASFREVGDVVQYTRQEIVDLLGKAGFHEAAVDAQAELPDPVDLEYVQKWAGRRGITRDILISRMGGSP
jgi:hypothetical protein